jgi:hypothetical protein
MLKKGMIVLGTLLAAASLCFAREAPKRNQK